MMHSPRIGAKSTQVHDGVGNESAEKQLENLCISKMCGHSGQRRRRDSADCCHVLPLSRIPRFSATNIVPSELLHPQLASNHGIV